MKSLTLTFILLLNLLAYSQGGSIQEVYLGTTFYVGVPKSSSIIFRLTGLENPIPNNGAIKISFPTGFTLPAQMSVSPVSGIGSGAYVQVIGQDIVIRNGSTYSQSSIIVGLYATQGGILASTNNTGTLEVETLDAAGNVIDTNRNGSISILPTTLRALSINSSNDTTSTMSILRVEFNTTNPVPASTSIKMRIPVANPLAPTDLQTYIPTNLTSCINRTGEPQDLECGFNNDWLVINNAFPQGTSQSTHFVFEVQEIRNPNSVSPMSGFEVYLCSNDELNFYEQATNGVLTVNTPATIQNLNVTSSTKVVYTMTNLTVEIFPNGFINPNSSVRIRFPDDLSLRESVRILGGRNTKQGQLNYTLSGQTIQLNQVFDSYFQDDSFSFSVQNIRNPARTTSDLVFQVQITDESSFTINQGSVNTTYETVNGIYIRNITTNNRVVSTQATYVFEIGFDMPPSLGDIEVIFPEEISLQFFNDNLCTALTGINTGASCTIEAGKAIFHDVFPLRGSNTTMSFSIGNVLNPTSTDPTGSFQVQTVRDDQVLQASEEDFSITAISSELTVDQIQFVNPTVATTGSLLVSLTTTSPVPTGSFIEFDLGSLDISRVQCQGIVGIPFSASCQLEQGKLILRNGITTDRASGSQFTLVIGGVASPRSVRPVCGLTATIRAQDGSVITETHENLCVDASKEAAISSDITALVSTLNQDVDLRVELTVQNTIEPDDVLSIKIPSELSWDAQNSNIRMITPYEQELVIADISGDTAEIPFSFTIARAELITLEIGNIVNNQLNNSIQGFEFTVVSREGFAVAKGVNNVTILFQNTTANNLTEIECSSTKVGAVANYNITFPSGLSLRQIGGVYIDFPSSFLLLQDDCLITNTPGECSRVSRTSVYLTNFQGNTSPEELMVNIPAVQNALSNQESLEPLSFEIKDLRNQTIELRQAAFSFNLECDVGCLACDGSASLCLSCTEGYELLENTCVPLCPLGSGLSGSTCRACQESYCMECYGSWDQCSACESGYQLVSGKCVDEDEVSSFSEKETDGISPYFLVIIILFAFCTAVALLIWFRRHYLSLKGILLSIYAPLDVLCLAFLSYYVSTFAQPIEFIIIGFLWLIHIGLQVYGALKLLRLIKNPDKLPQPMPVYYYASTFIDIRIITYYLSMLNNLVIDLKEPKRREINYKYLVIFTLSSLKSLFVTVFCFSILSESTRISRDAIFFFCEYGAFSVILIILTLILLFRLLRDVIERRPYQRPFTMEKQFVIGQEQSQENSAGFKGSPARKDNRFLNAAKTLAKDLDFTTLRKKFGRDFSEIRKLLTFDTTKRGSFMDAKRLRSEDRDYRQAPEFEEFTLKAFSEDPNKRRRERNSLLISDFQADKTEADEVRSCNTIMTMKYVSPQVGQNGEEEEAHLKNKVNSFQTKLSMYSFS